MGFVEATFEPGENLLNVCTVLARRKLQEVPVVFVEPESLSLSEAELQLCQFLLARYASDHEESPAEAFEELASIDVLAAEAEGEADLDVFDVTGVPTSVVQPVSMASICLFLRRALWLASPFHRRLRTYFRC